jgi:hypothetical protein
MRDCGVPRLVLILLVVACSSSAAPADSADSAAGARTACPEARDKISTLALGTLVGADATRVLFRASEGGGLMAWPKGGGVATGFTTEDLGTNLTISGGTYYWIAPGGRTIHATDERGAILRTVPLASATNTATQLAVAPGGGVYVLARCSESSCATQPADTIELLTDRATSTQTLAAGAAKIGAIAATSDALYWAESIGAPGDPVRIIRRDAATGDVTTLVDHVTLRTEAGGLAIAGDELFDVAFDVTGSGRVAIERRALADGTLREAYPAPDYSGFHVGGPPQWLVRDADLYWTEATGVIFGPPQTCSVPTGLFRLRAPDRTPMNVDGSASPSRLISDGDVLYYSYSEVTACCSGNGHSCTPPLPRPPEVRCYRKP